MEITREILYSHAQNNQTGCGLERKVRKYLRGHLGPTSHHRSTKVSYECHRDPSLRVNSVPFPHTNSTEVSGFVPDSQFCWRCRQPGGTLSKRQTWTNDI